MWLGTAGNTQCPSPFGLAWWHWCSCQLEERCCLLAVLKLYSVAEDAGIMHLTTVASDGVHELAFLISKNLHNQGLLFLSHTPSYTAKESFRWVPGGDMNPIYRAAQVAMDLQADSRSQELQYVKKKGGNNWGQQQFNLLLKPHKSLRVLKHAQGVIQTMFAAFKLLWRFVGEGNAKHWRMFK